MAQPISTSTFTGTINLDPSVKQNKDLSNIEVKIYSLAVAYTDPTSGQNDYSETYVSSTTTNKLGAFTFTKPSTYFKIEIILSSLPNGVGIDRYECVYENGQTSDSYTVYNIHNAELVMETVYDKPYVMFTASNGKQIFREYDIQLSKSSRSTVASTADILDIKQVTFAGSVSGFDNFTFSKHFNLSELSSLEKVEFYANTNMITEKEKIEKYCDLVETGDFVAGSCINQVLNDITSYAITNKKTLSSAEYSRLVRSSSRPNIDDYPNKVENNYFIIHYQNNITQQQATAIAQLFLNHRNNLMSLGFRVPLPDQYYHLIGLSEEQAAVAAPNTKINVFVTGDESGESYGATWGINKNGNTYESIIAIYNIHNGTYIEPSTFTNAAETIAHEYFHAVQNAYNGNYAIDAKWFFEACATWYSIYMDNAKNITNQINRYFTFGKFKNAIYTDEEVYAKSLFPLTIDIAYGGTNTIKFAYQYLATLLTGEYNFNSIKSAVDYAISANNRIGTFNDVFKTFSIYNTNPNYYYITRIPFEDEAEGIRYEWNNTNYLPYYSNQSFAPYSTLYFKISPPLTDHIYTVNGSITLTNSFSSGSISVAKICKTSAGTYNFSYITANNKTFSISESALGSPAVKELYCAIINTGTSNYVSADYSLSAN